MENIKHFLLLDFENILWDEEIKNLNFYLEGLDKDEIIRAGIYFLSFLNSKSAHDDMYYFLSKFFNKENESFANQIYKRCIDLRNKAKKDIKFFNNLSSLQLFQYAYNLKDIKTITFSNTELEHKIFRAYLFLNYQNNQSQLKASSSTKDLPTYSRAPKLIFSSICPFNDIQNYNIDEVLITQFIRSFYFFEYINSRVDLKPLIDEFLKYFNTTSTNEFLANLTDLALLVTKREIRNEKHLDIDIPKNDNYNRVTSFIEKLTINNSQGDEDIDFIQVRDTPLFRIEEGKYRIIFNLFVVEKLFKSLYFIFRRLNSRLPKGIRIEVKQLFSFDFSEQILLDKICKEIFHFASINMSGHEITNKNIEGGPDHYIRDGNSVYLFESKDVLINSNVKGSFDFNLYQEALKIKFHSYIDKNKPRYVGVKQLINNIEVVLSQNFEFDKQRVDAIFPILIIHDRQLDVSGFNFIINEWFDVEIKELYRKGFPVQLVRPITVINIDSLIYSSDYFKNRYVDLGKLIDLYFNFHSGNCKYYLDNYKSQNIHIRYPIEPFSLMLSNLLASNKMNMPTSLFYELGKKIAMK